MQLFFPKYLLDLLKKRKFDQYENDKKAPHKRKLYGFGP